MMRISRDPRDRICEKDCGFLSFAKSMCKNIVRNISKTVSGKYNSVMLAMRKKLLDHAKQYATDAFKTASKRAIQKTREAFGDLIGNKIAYKITKV